MGSLPRFCTVRRRTPFLLGESRAERFEDEENLLMYMVHVGQTMAKAADTVRKRMFAIRQHHVSLGHPDPLVGKLRVTLAL